ncbi:MAG TPA: AsmA-like C-terminal region-containing protein, partial [Leptospiraceae bacterium]|nr:AsmA-like C-terminal region-containing protein [Leptospiraceae bacterium]
VQAENSGFSSRKIFQADAEEISFHVTWKSLLGKEIGIKDAAVKGMRFHYFLEKPEKDKKEKKEQSENPFQEMKKFSMSAFSIERSSIIVYKDDKIIEDFTVQEFSIDNSIIQGLEIFLDIKYLDGRAKGKVIFRNDSFTEDFDKWKFSADLDLTSFRYKFLKSYYSFFHRADFDRSELTGNVYLTKKTGETFIRISTKLQATNPNFYGMPALPPLELNSVLLLHYKPWKLVFETANVNFGSVAVGSAAGELSFGKNVNLYLNIYANYADLENLIGFITSFFYFTLPPGGDNITFSSTMIARADRVRFRDFDLGPARVNLNIVNAKVGIQILEGTLYGGKISGSGTVDASYAQTSYSFNVSLSESDVEKIIKKYSKEPVISGRISSEFSFYSIGNTTQEFIKNFISSGSVKVESGKLLGFANLYKPIMQIGKLLNFTGPKGESTEFKSINMKFRVGQENVDIKDFKLTGVGIDAAGKGNVDFKLNSDFRFNIGLAGLAGKAFSVPIVYKGTLPNVKGYIDPVWLGTVYIGSTVIPGPIGTTAGGLAGNAISDYVHRAVEGLKEVFSIGIGSKKENEK